MSKFFSILMWLAWTACPCPLAASVEKESDPIRFQCELDIPDDAIRKVVIGLSPAAEADPVDSLVRGLEFLEKSANFAMGEARRSEKNCGITITENLPEELRDRLRIVDGQLTVSVSYVCSVEDGKFSDLSRNGKGLEGRPQANGQEGSVLRLIADDALTQLNIATKALQQQSDK